jgi:hypothetical protein
MSSLNSIGSASPNLTNVLSAFNGSGQVANDGSQGPLSVAQLQRALRQQLDQAFKKGSSLADTGDSLADKVSTTLQQYGVSDDQTGAVVNRLKDIFAKAGSRSEARQNAQELLDTFVQGLNGSSDGQSTAGSADSGQNIDFTA